MPDTGDAVKLFRHRPEDAAKWLRKAGFAVVKAQDFLAFKHPTEESGVYFKAAVARTIG